MTVLPQGAVRSAAAVRLERGGPLDDETLAAVVALLWSLRSRAAVAPPAAAARLHRWAAPGFAAPGSWRHGTSHPGSSPVPAGVSPPTGGSNRRSARPGPDHDRVIS